MQQTMGEHDEFTLVNAIFMTILFNDNYDKAIKEQEYFFNKLGSRIVCIAPTSLVPTSHELQWLRKRK